MYDLLIIGSGGAGLSAALEAKKDGLHVAIICQSSPTSAATCMAQGGLNGVIYEDEGDSSSLHASDTIKGGAGLCNKKMVYHMCEGAKEDILWLESIGMPFSRTKERVAQRRFGAASRNRTTYSQDYTGLKLLHTLYDNCLKEGVDFLDKTFVLDLIVEESVCSGVVVLRDGKVEALKSKSTLLATGGYAGIYYGFSTNAAESTGDGIALALRAGARLSDMEFVQFHPTSLKSSSVLVSESARGAGGFLVNQKGERFVDELMTRDEVSRAVFLQIENGNEVFLDIRHLGGEFISKNLPQEKKLIQIHEHIDPCKELIPVSPAAHYSMGGIDVDENLQTSLRGLYAVGECSNMKVHGANRLGGNSLLEIVHFGRAVVSNLRFETKHVDIKKYEEKAKQKLNRLFSDSESGTFFELRSTLGKELFKKAGIFRDKLGLEDLVKTIENLQNRFDKLTINDSSLKDNNWLVCHLKFANALSVSEVLAQCALSREESRGAHFRKEFQSTNNIALHSYIDISLEARLEQ